jgi:hypothetical protein
MDLNYGRKWQLAFIYTGGGRLPEQIVSGSISMK